MLIILIVTVLYVWFDNLTETPFKAAGPSIQFIGGDLFGCPLSLLQHSQFQGNTMAQSSIMDEDSLKRILLGAVVGGVITAFAGFSGLGWTFESTAKDMAKKSANEAVVGALAPICADKFQHAADPTKNRVDLMKVGPSEQGSFIEKGGWAKFPGSSSANNSAVAEACAKILSALK